MLYGRRLVAVAAFASMTSGRLLALLAFLWVLVACNSPSAQREQIGSVQAALPAGAATWVTEAKLLGSVPQAGGSDASTQNFFGWSVSQSGSTIVAGSMGESSQGFYSGAAYVYVASAGGWREQAKLVARLKGGALDGAESDAFGQSVGISGDTIVVGAPGDDDNGSASGSAYVYVRQGDFWLPEAKLLAADGAGTDAFGRAVAISGDTIVVGALYDGGLLGGSGSCYVFVRKNGIWSQQAKLMPRLPGEAPDAASQFGTSVDVFADTIVVGTAAWGGAGAYVYVRNASTWTAQAKLVPQLPDGTPQNALSFASSVSIYADAIAVGEYGDADGGEGAGAVYVYARRGTTWRPQAKLVAQLANGTPDAQLGANFGASVRLAGDTLVIGANRADEPATDSGSAYVFRRNGSAWTPWAKLLATLPNGTQDGAANEDFGMAVTASEDGIAVAAPYDALGQLDQAGSIYAYVESKGSWAPQAKLTAELPTSEPTQSVAFGSSVSVSADTIAVSDNLADAQGAASGAVDVYQKVAGRFSIQAQLFAQLDTGELDESPGDIFGSALAIAGDRLAVGAAGKNNNSGAVYVYARSGAAWNSQGKLLATLPGGADDGHFYDGFGASLSLSDDTLVVGAPAANGPVYDTGAVYVYLRSGKTWNLQAKLVARLPGEAIDAETNDSFGSAVSLSGDTLVVGAPGDADRGSYSGSAYVFIRNGTSWAAQAKLLARLPGNTLDGASSDLFGGAVSLSGDTAVIGATGRDVGPLIDAGAAYVFTRTGSTWSPQAKLTAQTPEGSSNAGDDDQFAGALSLVGDVVVIGARSNDDAGFSAGCAYVYARSGVDWSIQDRLFAELPSGKSDAAESAAFGGVVALADQTLVIGASGAAYVAHALSNVGVGGICDLGAQCESGVCVDGVCCPATCQGPCNSCASFVTGKPDGTCAALPAETRCGPDSLTCKSTELYALASRCDGAGTCEERGAACAGGYACVQGAIHGACADACSAHSDCADAYWCDSASKTCQLDKGIGGACKVAAECKSAQCSNGKCLGAPGDACAAGGQCASSYCANGVCCTSECIGVCAACDVPGSKGTCVAVPKGEAPHAGRSCQSAHPKCGAGVCDQSHLDTCTFLEGEPCGDTICSGAALKGDLCSADGKCVPNGTSSCGAYQCLDGSSCRDSCSAQGHCNTGYRCDFDTNKCVGVLQSGEKCNADTDCDSGACADGLCCNTQCDGQCEACDVSGKEGKCQAIAGKPHGDRKACDPGDHPACGATCDGGKRDGCAYPDQGTPCEAASCDAVSVLTPARVCDGAGSCTLDATQACYPFACDADAASCGTTCKSSDECAAGAVCDTAKKQCAPASGVCKNSSTVRLPDGSQEFCAPYICQSGACLRDCQTNANCAESFECLGGECITPEAQVAAPSKSSDGCGCRVAGGSSGRESLWFLSLLAFALVRRRR